MYLLLLKLQHLSAEYLILASSQNTWYKKYETDLKFLSGRDSKHSQ